MIRKSAFLAQKSLLKRNPIISSRKKFNQTDPPFYTIDLTKTDRYLDETTRKPPIDPLVQIPFYYGMEKFYGFVDKLGKYEGFDRIKLHNLMLKSGDDRAFLHAVKDKMRASDLKPEDRPLNYGTSAFPNENYEKELAKRFDKKNKDKFKKNKKGFMKRVSTGFNPPGEVEYDYEVLETEYVDKFFDTKSSPNQSYKFKTPIRYIKPKITNSETKKIIYIHGGGYGIFGLMNYH